MKINYKPDSTTTTTLPQWLICTTCTFSYMFSDSITSTAGETVEIQFKEGAEKVTVVFHSIDLVATGSDGVDYTWTQDVGVIATSF